jgi:hypothetical protein
MYKGYKIRAHIEPENIFNGWDDVDLLRVDEKGSMKKYAELVYEALKETFPGADIEAGPQNPWRTHVIGDLCQAGGWRGKLAEEVDRVIGEVWESEQWVVYYDTHDMEIAGHIDAGHSEYWAGTYGQKPFFAWAYQVPRAEESLPALLSEALANGKTGDWKYGAVMGEVKAEIVGCADTFIGFDDALVEQLRAMAEKL